MTKSKSTQQYSDYVETVLQSFAIDSDNNDRLDDHIIDIVYCQCPVPCYMTGNDDSM